MSLEGCVDWEYDYGYKELKASIKELKEMTNE